MENNLENVDHKNEFNIIHLNFFNQKINFLNMASLWETFKKEKEDSLNELNEKYAEKINFLKQKRNDYISNEESSEININKEDIDLSILKLENDLRTKLNLYEKIIPKFELLSSKNREMSDLLAREIKSINNIYKSYFIQTTFNIGKESKFKN